MPTVEQKIFEAYQNRTSLLLDPNEVEALMRDDAICCRITNAACHEAGIEEAGADCISRNLKRPESWRQFRKRLREGSK